MTPEDANYWLPRVREAVPEMVVDGRTIIGRQGVVLSVRTKQGPGKPRRFYTILESTREAEEFCQEHAQE